MKRFKDLAIKYGSTVLFGTLLVFLTLWLRDYYKIDDQLLKYRYLADAFTVPGILFICVGFIVVLSNEGAFDGIGYALRHVVVSLIPLANRKKEETYYEYKQNKRKLDTCWFIFFTGIAFLLVAIVFIVLFYNLKTK